MTREELKECLVSAVNEAITKSARVRLILLEMQKLDIASVELGFELAIDSKGKPQPLFDSGVPENGPKIDDAEFLRSMGIAPDLEIRD